MLSLWRQLKRDRKSSIIGHSTLRNHFPETQKLHTDIQLICTAYEGIQVSPGRWTMSRRFSKIPQMIFSHSGKGLDLIESEGPYSDSIGRFLPSMAHQKKLTVIWNHTYDWDVSSEVRSSWSCCRHHGGAFNRTPRKAITVQGMDWGTSWWIQFGGQISWKICSTLSANQHRQNQVDEHPIFWTIRYWLLLSDFWSDWLADRVLPAIGINALLLLHLFGYLSLFVSVLSVDKSSPIC